MRLLGIFIVAVTMSVQGGDELPTWSDEALRTGWGHHQCTPSCGPEGLTADSQGRDPVKSYGGLQWR